MDRPVLSTLDGEAPPALLHLASDYDRIRVLFPDHLGIARGKYLPVESAGRGTAHCISLFALGYDREMTPHDGAMVLAGLPDCHATFDPGSVHPGWEPRTGVVVADLHRNGEPVELSPREVLKKQVALFTERGLAPKVGLEVEAYLFQRGPDGAWVPIDTPGAYVYGTGSAVDPTGTVDEVMTTARAMGLALESVNSEYDNGQFEFTLAYGDAMRICDDALLLKVMAREIAARNGLLMTFIGKPITERGGSGLHVNMSFSTPEGTNALADPTSEDGLSDIARRSIAGMLHHHEGLTALLAPTVNAYRRLQPGSLCGYWANWGHDHRGVTVRVAPERGERCRLEHRVPDGATNPHQAVAAVLAAARLGLDHGYDCPEAETLDCLEEASTDVVVPPFLGAALDALEADRELIDAFSPAFVDGFLATKRAEWDRYMRHTSDWELNEYLPFL